MNNIILEDWLVRCCELVDKYSPRVMYFDWWVEMPEFKQYMRKFLAYFYNKNLEIYGDCGVVIVIVVVLLLVIVVIRLILGLKELERIDVLKASSVCRIPPKPHLFQWYDVKSLEPPLKHSIITVLCPCTFLAGN